MIVSNTQFKRVFFNRKRGHVFYLLIPLKFIKGAITQIYLSMELMLMFEMISRSYSNLDICSLVISGGFGSRLRKGYLQVGLIR